MSGFAGGNKWSRRQANRIGPLIIGSIVAWLFGAVSAFLLCQRGQRVRHRGGLMIRSRRLGMAVDGRFVAPVPRLVVPQDYDLETAGI